MKLGNIADGDHFHGRKQEIAKLSRRLTNDSIVFSGPRRLGKSSILRRLCEVEGEQMAYPVCTDAKGGEVMRPVHLDVGGCDSVTGFVRHLDKAIPEEMMKIIFSGASNAIKEYVRWQAKSNLGDSGSKAVKQLVGVQPTETWRSLAQSLQHSLSPIPLIIMLDEFSVFLDKSLKTEPEETVNLLDWLRAWRQSSGVKCRFIFTGSISLNSVLESNGIYSRFNDCYDYKLGAFKPEEAEVLLSKESKRLKWQLNDEVLQCLCKRVGWLSPFFLNLLLDEAIRIGAERLEETGVQTYELQLADVNLGYERLISVSSRFAHWHQRLKGIDDSAMILAILAAVARSSTDKLTRGNLRARLHKLDIDPTRRSQRLDAILMQLVEEGYLTQSEGGMQFLSPIVRDYWKRNHA